ncbi:hypothetical protein LVT94_12250 [Clostridioides difficile]|nr:hypothetical protein [Clostridioides difficile]HDN2435964.1 hypothetical protein [Clostridioides difficile]
MRFYQIKKKNNRMGIKYRMPKIHMNTGFEVSLTSILYWFDTINICQYLMD